MKLVVSQDMVTRMGRALREGGGIYTMDDIGEGLATGKMQGHTFGDSWGITQVHDLPHNRFVNILVVVGVIEDAPGLEDKITGWARSIGATRLTAIGREGWWKRRTEGWNKVGVMYAKGI